VLRVERERIDADSTGMIDAHQHFWIYSGAEYAWIDESMASLRRDFLPSDSSPEMASVACDACVAVQARQSLEETRFLLALADAHPSIAGVVGWIDLQAGAAAVRRQLTALAGHPKFVGVRHIVQTEPDDRFLVRSQVIEGLSVVGEFDLAFDLLIYTHHLPVAAECVARLPRQRFVLDHLAKPGIRRREMTSWEAGIRALASLPNVVAKLSGLVTEADWTSWTADDIRPYLDVAFDAFGLQRLMIGSDWPVCLVAATYGRAMGVVIDYLASRPEHERRAVLSGNAERFWRLKRGEAQDSMARSAAADSGM